MQIELNQINKIIFWHNVTMNEHADVFILKIVPQNPQIHHSAAHGQWILVWGTQELQYDSVIYRMAIECSNLLPYGK